MPLLFKRGYEEEFKMEISENSKAFEKEVVEQLLKDHSSEH